MAGLVELDAATRNLRCAECKRWVQKGRKAWVPSGRPWPRLCSKRCSRSWNKNRLQRQADAREAARIRGLLEQEARA